MERKILNILPVILLKVLYMHGSEPDITAVEDNKNLTQDLYDLFNIFMHEVEDNPFEHHEPVEVFGHIEPYFHNGLWKCGDCEVVDESKLKYSELYAVEKNMDNDVPAELQVAVGVSDMKCILITTGSNDTVERVAGLCSGGDSATFRVKAEDHFTVNVYVH